MLFLGSHVSIDKGYTNAIIKSKDINANACQIFLKPPLKLSAKAKLSITDYTNLKNVLNNDFKLIIHSSYTINSGKTLEDPKVKIALDNYIDDLEMCNKINGLGCIIHMGKHCNTCSVDESLNYMVNFIKNVYEKTEHLNSKIIIENSAQQGTEIGYNIEQMSIIWNRIPENMRHKIGFCLDTCHGFAAGMDFRCFNKTKDILNEFNDKIGLENLLVIHLNDSKKEFACKKDRHESIGLGYLFDKNKGGSFDGLKVIIEFAKNNSIPIILETPNKVQSYEDEIKLIRDNLI